MLSPINIYLYWINTICRIQIIQGPNLPGPDLPRTLVTLLLCKILGCCIIQGFLAWQGSDSVQIKLLAASARDAHPKPKRTHFQRSSKKGERRGNFTSNSLCCKIAKLDGSRIKSWVFFGAFLCLELA